MWNFVLNRRGSVSLRDQLAREIELMILQGSLRNGQRLPSMRSLARRLRIQTNTVAAAYRLLKSWGLLETNRGSGAFACRGTGPAAEPRDVEALLRGALQSALRSGLAPQGIRAAVGAWLAAPVPDRLVVVDPTLETAELLAYELRRGLDLPIVSGLVDEAEENPHSLANSVVAALPLHVERLARIAASRTDVKVVPLRLTVPDVKDLQSLPSGSLVLVVSHSSRVLPYAARVIQRLRGDEIVVESRLLTDVDGWMSLAKVVDLILADGPSHAVLRNTCPSRLQELRLLSPTVWPELREALCFPSIRLGPTASAPTASNAETTKVFEPLLESSVDGEPIER
jgi:GntR family transcriptional regulator